MKISNFTGSDLAEKPVALDKAGVGSIVRFPCFTFAEAISGKDEAGFYMVINKHPAITGRVTLLSLDGSVMIERDADREVFVHQAEMIIREN